VVLDPAQNMLYMSGGCDKSGCATDTLYQLDLTAYPSSKWQLVDGSAGTKPPPRCANVLDISNFNSRNC
jgi:hypothetical protein